MCSAKDHLLTHISSNPWFAAMDARERRKLLAGAVTLHFRAGEYVYNKGDLPNGFYGLVDGVLRGSTLLENGKEAILGLIEPGIWFGETSMIDGLPRSIDVTALDDSKVLRVDMATFVELMRGNSFARSIALLQATRMRSLYAVIEDATLRSTRSWIARQLQRLARAEGAGSGGGYHVVAISQEMLAMTLGISRQTLALELKAMAARGILSIEYGRIRISSIEALKEVERET